MAFEFRLAVRENVSLLIALAGASGSGKTLSALRLADGMSPSGKIAFLDTEARRALHYADSHKFLHADMRPPFRPANFLEAIHAAEQTGAEVIIVDSFSHEYDGEGGILDWASEIEAGGTKAPGNWKVPKLAHKKLMNALLQCRASIIFCLRADEKIKIDRQEVNGHMKTVIVPLGWMPICEKRFMFEMTASFTLTPDNPGKPNFRLPHKLQEQHRAFFGEGKCIDEASGSALAEWARGGAARPASTRDLFAEGSEAAERGMDALRSFWSALAASEKRDAGGSTQLDEWKKIAAQSDASFNQDSGDPDTDRGGPETDPDNREPPIDAPALLDAARSQAMDGRKVFDPWFAALTDGGRAALQPHVNGLLAAADKADGK